MFNLLFGNLCSLLAMATDSVSASREDSRGVLIWQSVSQVIYGVGTLALKGYRGAVQNAVSLLRNIAAICNFTHPALQWALVILGVVWGLACNNLGLVGLLPVVANLEYTLAIFRFQNNERALKTAFMVCVFLFVLFNLAIFNIVGALSNLVVFLSTGFFLLRTRK